MFQSCTCAHRPTNCVCPFSIFLQDILLLSTQRNTRTPATIMEPEVFEIKCHVTKGTGIGEFR